MTRLFAAGLTHRGFTVVSGLAAGVDGEAHRASLASGGSTVAVLGAGLDRIYPYQHRQLAHSILESGRGALVTEFPFSSPPRSFHFPLRNRILSGLSDALLVVEAGERSGSLITASHALQQGRTIYVVPGRIGPEAIGGLRLLADGATPALEPADVLPFCGNPLVPEVQARATPLGGPYGLALDRLFREEDAWHPDQIAERLGAPPAAILAELTRLELEGLLERLPGGAYVKPE